MKHRRRAITTVALGLAMFLLCDPGSAATPAALSCIDLARGNDWTRLEILIWRKLCAGRPANVTKRRRVDPSIASEDVRASFLRTLAFDAKYFAALPLSGIVIIGARFRDVVDLSDVHLSKPVLLSNCRFDQDFKMRRASTEYTFSLEHTFVSGHIDLSVSTFAQLVLAEVQAKKLTLAASTVKNQLVLWKANIAERANLFSLKAQTVFFNLATIGDELDMTRATIQGDVYLRGISASFVNMTGARIDGMLSIDANTLDNSVISPHWSGKELLVLRDAKVGLLTTDRLGPPVWPRNTDLNGLTYSRLGRESGADLLASPLSMLVGWLRARPASVGFASQPYEQLATVLKSNGYYDTAADVLYTGKWDELRNTRCADVSSCARALVLLVSWATIGFGHRLYWALGWAIGFFVVGGLVFRRADDIAVNAVRRPWIYSFDVLIPLVTLREAHKGLVPSGWRGRYYYVHKVAGYILATFIVAAMAGFTK